MFARLGGKAAIQLLSVLAGGATTGNALKPGQRLVAAIIFLTVGEVAPVNAADLPLAPPKIAAPSWSWQGFYVGGHIGAAAGATTFSDPFGSSLIGDKVTTPGFLAGGQLGYDWLVAPQWIVGLEAAAGALDSHDGTNTCMQASVTIIGSNCEVMPRALASFTARLGFLPDAKGHTLVYGKAGGAWTRADITINPNKSFLSTTFPQAIFPGAPTNERTSAWGWTIGGGIEQALAPAWSLSLDYRYYRFATTRVSSPNTINVTQAAEFSEIPGSPSSVTQYLHIIELGLNYHWGADPGAIWTEALARNTAPMPVKARPLPAPMGWDVDAGVRYWYSTGKSKSTSGVDSLTSQLTYDNMTGHSGEVFARLDTPPNVFAKGFIGGGAITTGKMNDEDWGLVPEPPPVPTPFEVTQSNVSGSLKYATADVGFNVLRNRDAKIGPFIGYNYFHQTMNTFGCVQLVLPGSACDPPVASNILTVTQADTWQSLRIGIAAETVVGDRFSLSGDVAYLPHAHFTGLDTHSLRQPVTLFPEDGTGHGVQAEVILSYLVTETLTLGVGARYWSMWTTNASQTCTGACLGAVVTTEPPSPITTSTQRYGMFAQLAYRFYPHQ
jgi:opacity protein-like surface antigen